MDETQSSPFDAWLTARAGHAIDVLVDRTLNTPQYGSDPAQAYGVDDQGRIYQLGQSNGQVVARVSQPAAGLTLSPGFLMLCIIGLVLVAD